jgi:Initiator Replication protein
MKLSEKHVIKHSAAVQITNTISLLQRKAWNVLLANAYDRLPKQDFFEVDIAELVDVLKYDSKNKAYLKANLKTLMQSIVEWDVLDRDGDQEWSACVLLANVQIKNNVLRYSYSPLLKERLYNPSTYARISLSMQSRFKSKYALPLFRNL